MKRLNNFGDTIVEVLIAMAVVGVILGGAYVTVQKSFNQTRDAQEHGEALNLAQSQTEQLIKAAGNPAGRQALVDQTKAFCFANDGTGISSTNNITATNITPTNPQNNTLVPAANDPFTQYVESVNSIANTGCAFQPQGGVKYYTAIEKQSNTYVIHVRWDRVGGGSKREVTISYRLYL